MIKGGYMEDTISIRLKNELIYFTEKKFCEYYYNGVRMGKTKELIKQDIEKIVNDVLYITSEG